MKKLKIEDENKEKLMLMATIVLFMQMSAKSEIKRFGEMAVAAMQS